MRKLTYYVECDKDHPQFVLLFTIALTLWVDIVGVWRIRLFFCSSSLVRPTKQRKRSQWAKDHREAGKKWPSPW